MYGDGFPTHRFELCWRVDDAGILSDERIAQREGSFAESATPH